MVTKLIKFRLLWWKNWKIQFKQRNQLVFELLLPFVLSWILLTMRKAHDIYHYDEVTYDPFDTSCRPFESEYSLNTSNFIAYSPDNNTFIRRIARDVLLQFNENKDNSKFLLSEHSSAEHLNKFILSENPFVGIEFKDNLKGATELPSRLEYSLRFRGKGIIYVWETDHIKRVKRFSDGARNAYADDGGPPFYQQRCFLTLQKMIDEAFLNLNSSFKNDRDIHFIRFPEKQYSNDSAYKTLIYIVPLLLFINYTFAVDNIISNVSSEREKNVKLFLKAMGLTKSLQWTAWMVKSLCFNLISITVFVVLLTSFISGTQQTSVFHFSNAFLIWLFLLFYIMNIITFSCFMSLFGKKSKIASVIGIIAWVATYVPYNLVTATTEYYDNFSSTSQYFLALLCNTGMGFGFNTIFALEWQKIGLTWSTLFTRVDGHGLSVGEVNMIFIFSTSLYVFLIAHMEKIRPELSKPKKWYHPFKLFYKEYFSKNYETLDEIPQGARPSGQHGFQQESCDDECSFIIKGITKLFKKKVVIENFHLNLYQDQITILLGNNGSGKSTILSILEGICPFNQGEAIIYGKDLKMEINALRELFGLKFQSESLMDYLTVEDHIKMFCCLRGMEESEITVQLQKYTDALNLRGVLNELVRKLTKAEKRKLAIAIALCGDSKIVLLDEPTHLVDSEDKEKIWDLLDKEKRGRTILVATQNNEEANMYGDRIVTLGRGEIKAIGSPAFLRKSFGIGYRLVCIKKDDCKSDQITDLLRGFVPDIEIELETDTGLTYILNESYLSRFPEMFDCLENQFYSLRLSSFSVSMANLDDIMLRKVSSIRSFENGNQSGTNYFGLTDEVPMINALEMDQQLMPQKLDGYQLRLNQFEAMIKKKIYYLRHNYKFFLINIVLSILFVIATLFGPSYEEPSYDSLLISLGNYSDTNVYLQSDNSTVAEMFKSIVGKSLPVIELSQGINIQEFILRNLTGSGLMAAAFNVSDIVLWFNNEYYHVLPLGLNLIDQAFLKTELGMDFDVAVLNKPYHITDGLDIEADLQKYSDNQTLAIVISILYIYWITMFMTLRIKEDTSGSKSLQFICGVGKFTYWSSALLIDTLSFIFATLFIIFTIMCFNGEAFFSGFGWLLEISFFFALAALPFMYLMSRDSKESFNSKLTMILIALFTGMVPYLLLQIIGFFTINNFIIFYFVFLLSPYFILFDILWDFQFYTVDDLLKYYCDVYEVSECSARNLCYESIKFCDATFVDHAVSEHILYLVLGCLLYLSLLVTKEYGFREYFCEKQPNQPPLSIPNENLDVDVREEKNKVASMSAGEIAQHSVVMKKVFSKPGILPEVRNFSLVVEDSSCICILGPKNSGKSSILKMLVQENPIFCGDAFIKNNNVMVNRREVHRKIGYCPNKFAFIKYLTGRENLEIFGLSKGIPRHIVQKEIRNIADSLKITDSLNKPVKSYNLSNRRKLCIAIALLGDPDVILLDNPLGYLDSESKRQVLILLNKLKSKGKSIILTSNQLDECELICNRLAIMVNGELIALGSPQHLKKKYSQGINLNIKIKLQENVLRIVQVDSIKDYIQRSFHKINMCNENNDEFVFNIDNRDLRWSEIFSTMEDLKEKFDIDRYSVTETSLEQIYNSIILANNRS